MKNLILLVMLVLMVSCKSTVKKPKPCDRSAIKVSTGNHYDIDCVDRIKINEIIEV